MQIIRGLVLLALAPALSGCISGIPLIGMLCLDQPQARSGIIMNALLGCPLEAVGAVPTPDMPVAFRNQTAEFALDPLGAGRAADPGMPARSIGVSTAATVEGLVAPAAQAEPAPAAAAEPATIERLVAAVAQPDPSPAAAADPTVESLVAPAAQAGLAPDAAGEPVTVERLAAWATPADPQPPAAAEQVAVAPAPTAAAVKPAAIQSAAYSMPLRPATNPLEAAQVAPPAPQLLEQSQPAEWWRLFGSSELNRLEQIALANNHDLKAAVARVDQAQALAGFAAGPLLPNFNYNGRGQSTQPNGGIGNRVPLPDGNSQRLYQIGAVASYEIDFWGKNRATMNSALAAAQASAYDRATVVMTLTADIAATYLQYLALSDRLTVAVSNVQTVTEVLATVQKRFAIGEGSDIEVQQQATALAQARAVVPTIVLAKEQVRLRLSTLLGLNPDQLNLTGASLVALNLPSAPRAIPSALLAQRPDLRKAEFDLISSNADIAAARGRLLPSFTLSAETGYGANYLTALFTPVGWYSILANSVSGVLFDNGRSLSDIELRRAISTERSEVYRQRIIDALRDVEDALANVRLSAEVEAAQQVAFERASRAYELAQMGLQLGTIDYLTILETERTRYQIEDARVQARLERLNAAVSLFRSLGGTTETPAS